MHAIGKTPSVYISDAPQHDHPLSTDKGYLERLYKFELSIHLDMDCSSEHAAYLDRILAALKEARQREST